MDPPFIKLRPTPSHGSSATVSSEDIESQGSNANPQTTPASSPPASPRLDFGTHNTTRARYHVKDIGEFAQALEFSANRALPHCGLPRYREVSALLLRWEEDEMQVEWELNNLDRVFRSYGFHTDSWLIPTKSPLRKVMGKVLQFIDDFESENTLLVVYYGGHAKINEARQSTWSCTRDLNYSSFEWNGCQSLFEQSKSDTLILLDCCAAAAAATSIPSRTNSITETIAACGWETWAPEPGCHSFTNALIEVLEEWINRPSFSAAMLHSEILSVLKQPRPKRRHEVSRTPVYIVTTSYPKACSIELRCYREVPEPAGATCRAAADNVVHALPISKSLSNPQEELDRFDLSSLIATLPDKSFVLPHVIMSVALEKDQTLELKAFENWVKQFPALAKYASIQGIYQSYSILVLLAVPVVIWNLLPENPACNFVGYVTSDNLISGQSQRRLSMQQTSAQLQNLSLTEPQSDRIVTSSLWRGQVKSVGAGKEKTVESAIPVLSMTSRNEDADATFSKSVETALKDFVNTSATDWAVLAVLENGEERIYTSPKPLPHGPKPISKRFYQTFRTYFSKPTDSVADSAYGSDTSGRRRLRLPRENLDDWNSDGSSSKTPIETGSFRRNIFQLKIGVEQEVERFYVTRFKDLQITACTIIANTFIKVLEPKKFLFFRYSRGNISAPPWWPATKSVRHREPSELTESEQIRLLVHILRLVTQPRAMQNQTVQNMGLTVKILESATVEALSGWFINDKHPENIQKKSFLVDIFKIARMEERYRAGEIDGTTTIPVTYLTSLGEESDEESDEDEEALE